MRVRRLMDRAVGVVRERASLEGAVGELGRLSIGTGRTQPLLGAAGAALLIAASALQRTESRGAHWRRDHPEPASHWEHPSRMTLADAEAIAATFDAVPAAASAA